MSHASTPKSLKNCRRSKALLANARTHGVAIQKDQQMKYTLVS